MASGAISTLNENLVALEAAVDDCSEVPLSCVSDDELSDRLVSLHRVEAKMAALRIEATEAARVASIASTSGQRNTANHLASITNVDPAAVRADERVGKWLRDYPEIAKAVQTGEITWAHAEKMRLVDDPRRLGQTLVLH